MYTHLLYQEWRVYTQGAPKKPMHVHADFPCVHMRFQAVYVWLGGFESDTAKAHRCSMVSEQAILLSKYLKEDKLRHRAPILECGYLLLFRRQWEFLSSFCASTLTQLFYFGHWLDQRFNGGTSEQRSFANRYLRAVSALDSCSRTIEASPSADWTGFRMVCVSSRETRSRRSDTAFIKLRRDWVVRTGYEVKQHGPQSITVREDNSHNDREKMEMMRHRDGYRWLIRWWW